MSRNQNIINDESLLGYLMLALPTVEQQQIDALAQIDPVLRQRIDDLRALLEPLQKCTDEFEPRANLAKSTMAFIQQSSDAEKMACDGPSGQVSMSQPLFESSRSTRLAWMDSIVALVASVIVLSFLLPSVWLTRESARRMSCAANLREIGEAFTSFAYGNPERKLPRIDVSGPLSFAGVYAMRLNDAGLLTESERLWCPSMSSVDVGQAIPTLKAYLAASPNVQSNWRHSAVGNYSYNLGNVVAGIYITPSIVLDRSFAIMGDSLLMIDSDEDLGPIHGRNAANILYSDGSIQYVRVDRIDAEQMDNPYLNKANQQAVGFGLEDCCLGPSFQFPWLPVKLD
jgi:hypothetical protein